MRLPDILRYGLWCGIIATAAGNRRQYAMTTTWLPHLTTNTVTLLLPDVLRVLMPDRPSAAGGLWRLPRVTLAAMVRDNPRYVLYVAPLAAGYLLSAPWLNIYKDDLGALRLAGFGLDALPHASTAFALTSLVAETARVAAAASAPADPLGALARWLDEHHALVSAAALTVATLLWELGEHKIYRHELARQGDATRTNMQWSVADMVGDCAANAIGWLLALAIEQAGPPQFATDN
jgi:hypothetical protein